jgi:hypothetical protein
MKGMRAIGVKEYGGPEALQEVDLPAEALGAGRVRLRVTAAAVNPADTGVRTGWAGTGWASRTGHPEEGVPGGPCGPAVRRLWGFVGILVRAGASCAMGFPLFLRSRR